MEPLDITLHLGQMLLVQTASELLTGTLKYIDSNRQIIELDNPYDQRSNCQYNSPQILAFPQIKKLQIIKDDEPTSNSNSCSDTGISPENKAESTKESDIALSATELELIHKQLNSVICITQTDQKYHKALADIRVQPVVALLMEPVNYGRAQRTSVMVVATFQNVYIFDIIALGSIFREIKQLLETERPRKVVHYSHKLVDHLKSRHAVKLGGIFDTFVAVSIVRGIKEPMNLMEAVEKTLNITQLFFQPEADDNLHNNPYKRPLSLVVRQVLAKKAILQLKLYEHLLHKHMLNNFYNQCDIFSHTFCESEDATTPLEMQRKSRAGFQHIKRNIKDFEFKFNDLKD